MRKRENRRWRKKGEMIREEKRIAERRIEQRNIEEKGNIWFGKQKKLSTCCLFYDFNLDSAVLYSLCAL
jgi:hypothetical protein